MSEIRPAPIRGVYAEPFWEYVAAEQLRLQQCDHCQRVWFPPGPSCPRCLSRTWRWTPVSGQGDLLSWATFHRQYLPTVPPPYTVVAVALAEGPILIADTSHEPADLQVDMRMRLTYGSAVSTEGDPLTLYHWEPSPSPKRPSLPKRS